MEFLRSLSPEFFDTVILVIVIIGLAAAGIRLYSDFSRPMPGDHRQKGEKQP